MTKKQFNGTKKIQTKTQTKIRKALFAAACAAVHLLHASAASASVVQYTNQSAFEAAVTGLQTLQFSAPAGSYTLIPGTLALSGVTFSNTLTSQNGGSGLAEVSQTYYGANYARGYDNLQPQYSNSSGPSSVTASLPAGITAFGVSLFTSTLGDRSGSLTSLVDITLGSQTFTVTSLTAPNLVFRGYISTTPIAAVTIVPETPAVYGDLAFVEIGSARVSATPEPATLLLMGSAGLLGFFWRRLR